MDERTIGMTTATSAYIIWGFLPAYWKLLDHIDAGVILAGRIIWAFIFMLIIVFLMRSQRGLWMEWKRLWQYKKRFFGLLLASLLISLNWLTYIWAVNNHYVIEASLGYYINPLISILLGMIVLRESLTRLQMISFALASIGVIYLTVSFGVFPWISFVLAISFALYGLLKKVIDLNEIFGLTIETLIVTPFALIYIWQISFNMLEISITALLLIGGGVVTAVPLLLFAYGTRRIPLSMVGFLQYIAPTIMLLLGIFAFDETFSIHHLFAFTCIWIALILYMRSAHLTYEKSRSQ